VRVTELGQSEIPNVVTAVTRLKTGSLTELAAVLGALAAGAPAEQVAALGRFGCEFGMALQMLDDLSGIVNERRCHKGHEDLLLSRPTWPWAWLAQELSATRFAELEAMAREVWLRERHPEVLAAKLRERLAPGARSRVHAHLARALDALRPQFAHAPAFAELVLEVHRLEAAYV
jgi:geranylgeranyl pyrophosphate synthase